MLFQRRQITRQIAMVLLLVGANATQAQSGLTGTIRDRQGKPQAGALIELLGASSTRDSVTDIDGHYRFRDVVPGVYALRASAALYLPSLRAQLQLQSRGITVVNLTLSGLFDEAAWLSTRSKQESQRDDWNWTLRSPENRPILRVLDDGATDGHPESEQNSGRSETHAVSTTSFSNGAFGTSGLSERFQIARRSRDHRTTLTAESEMIRTGSEASASPTFFSTGLERQGVGQSGRAVALRVANFPQIRDNHDRSLAVVDLASAERLSLGDFAIVELGSQSEFITAGASTLTSHPFVRVAARLSAGWMVSYAGATSPEFQSFNDVNGETRAAPAVQSVRTRIVAETGLHQQLGLRKTTRHGAFSVSYHHDSARTSAISGEVLGVSQKGEAGEPLLALQGLNALTLDRSNGIFHVFAPRASVNGLEVGADLRLGSGFSASGTYARSGAVRLCPALSDGRMSALSTRPSQAVIVVTQRSFPRSGTKVNVSYRWQPSRALSVVAPYDSSEINPYLGVHIRQSLAAKQVGLDRIQILLDADNLLGEGRHTYLLGRQQVNLSSAIPDMRAGLTFSY